MSDQQSAEVEALVDKATWGNTVERLNALDALAQRIETLSENNRHTHANLDFCIEQRETLTRQRDGERTRVKFLESVVAEAERAEAQRDRLAEALRRIERCEWQEATVVDLVQIARAALRDIEQAATDGEA